MSAPCIECGDHRGWRVEPDWHTGDAVQVQCRACTEHDCPRPVTHFTDADWDTAKRHHGLDTVQPGPTPRTFADDSGFERAGEYDDDPEGEQADRAAGYHYARDLGDLR